MDHCTCDSPMIRCDHFGCRCAICGGYERRPISAGLQKAIDETRQRIAEAAQPARSFRVRLRPRPTTRQALKDSTHG